MNKNIFLAEVAAISLCFTACVKDNINGEGPVVSEIRAASPFKGIELSINATVHFVEADTYDIRIDAQQNIAQVIQTEVNSEILVIKVPTDTRIENYLPINIYVQAPDADKFNLNGSGSILITDTLHASFADFNMSGSGSILVDHIISDDIDSRISGSGKLEIKNGSTITLRNDMSGSCIADLRNVQGSRADVLISGSAQTYINMSEKIDVKISGSGKLYYLGTPAIDSDISGSGQVIKL